MFDFDVAGSGHYHGVAAVQQTSPSIDIVQGSMNGTYYPETGDSSQVSMTVQGQINTATGQAQVSLWSGSSHYHLVTANGQIGDAQVMARQAMAALQAGDWTTLYTFLSQDVQGGISQSAFVQAMSSQGLPQLVSIDFNGDGTLQVIGGTTFYTQPLAGTAKKADGTVFPYATKMYEVLESGNWRVIGTDAVTAP